MADKLIRTTPELKSALAECRAAGTLALDTEFVWRSTYRPVLGLVQFGCGGEKSFALDVTRSLDPSPLAEALADESTVKILHDARQDLQHLRHYCGATPVNVFDTQLAAAFAGFGAGIGLGKLLFEAINIGLPKTETLTDWLQRPLTDAQVEYALDDVRYLPRLREALLAKSVELGTHQWLVEELMKYDEPSLYDDYDPATDWQKLKIGKLKGVNLRGSDWAVIRELAAMREHYAREWNKPRTWLGEDASLAYMTVDRSPRGLRHRLDGGHAQQLIAAYDAAIQKAARLPEEEWPLPPHRRYIPEVLDAADKAVAWLKEKAAAMHVAETVIASRATVTAYVDDIGDETNPLAVGWRYETVGREMAELFGVD